VESLAAWRTEVNRRYRAQIQAQDFCCGGSHVRWDVLAETDVKGALRLAGAQGPAEGAPSQHIRGTQAEERFRDIGLILVMREEECVCQ